MKEGALKKFQGLKKYDGEWKDGLKHGKAVIEHILRIGAKVDVTASPKLELHDKLAQHAACNL